MAGFATGLTGAGLKRTHHRPVLATATPSCVVLGKSLPFSEPGFSHPVKGQSSNPAVGMG